MEPLTVYSTANLGWVQPKTSQNHFELREGDHLYAALTFPKMFGSLAIGETSKGRWTFKRVGFFHTHITIRKEGEEADLGVFQPNWTGTEGKVTFAGGETYTWKAANFWATQYGWQDTRPEYVGGPLVLFKPGKEDAGLSDLFKTQARVEIFPEAEKITEISLLVLLGWYLMILKQQDDTATIAATTTTLS